MQLSKRISFILTGIGLALGMSTTSYAAEQDQKLIIDLQKAEQLQKACRISFLFQNKLSHPLKDMILDTAVLDKDGLAQQFLMLQTGALSLGKRRIRQYDLENIKCQDVGEILINDIAECQGASPEKDKITAESCLSALSASSRSKIKLGL